MTCQGSSSSSPRERLGGPSRLHRQVRILRTLRRLDEDVGVGKVEVVEARVLAAKDRDGGTFLG